MNNGKHAQKVLVHTLINEIVLCAKSTSMGYIQTLLSVRPSLTSFIRSLPSNHVFLSSGSFSALQLWGAFRRWLIMEEQNKMKALLILSGKDKIGSTMESFRWIEWLAMIFLIHRSVLWCVILTTPFLLYPCIPCALRRALVSLVRNHW